MTVAPGAAAAYCTAARGMRSVKFARDEPTRQGWNDARECRVDRVYSDLPGPPSPPQDYHAGQ
eukprot:76408-Pyramimonas_sp.AAC.1